jgi:DNA-binding FadR family transcriptional regulator
LPQRSEKLSLQPVLTQKPYEAVVEQLRGQIAGGKIRPGDRLPSERDLVEVFKVSRGAVREALRQLELSGLIQRKLGAMGGAFVISAASNAVVNCMRDLFFLGEVSPKDIVEARSALGTAVVRTACERISEEALAALDANIAAAELAGTEGQRDVQAAIHRQFHVLLAKATGNILMITMMEGLMAITHEFVRAAPPPSDADEKYTLRSRHRLLGHIRKRDADAAIEEYVKQHRRVLNRYLARSDEH